MSRRTATRKEYSMRVVVKIGYDDYLLPAGCDAIYLLDMLSQAQKVKGGGHYGDRTYSVTGPAEDIGIEAKIISDDAVCLPDNSPETLKEMTKLAKERGEFQSKMWLLEAEVKSLKAKLPPEEKEG